MSDFNNREGRGVLFREQKKRHDKAPDYKGDFVASRDIKKGEKIRIAGWYKATNQGHLISIAEDNYVANKVQSAPKYSYPREVNSIDDSEVPF